MSATASSVVSLGRSSLTNMIADFQARRSIHRRRETRSNRKLRGATHLSESPARVRLKQRPCVNLGLLHKLDLRTSKVMFE